MSKPRLSLQECQIGAELGVKVLGSHAKPDAQIKAERLLNLCLDEALALAGDKTDKP